MPFAAALENYVEGPLLGRLAGDNYREMNGLSKDSVNWLVVGEDAAGQRVDNYLFKVMKGVPKSHVYRILRSGEVRVNKCRVGPDARLAEGDHLRVPPVRAAQPSTGRTASPPAGIPVPTILFEDDSLLALDKPSGLAVHGGSGISFGVIERLRLARPEAKFLELVHRLDRDTSGVLLIAKKRSALTGLHAQLREGETEKRYFVLVRGAWRDAVRAVDLALETFVSGGGERRVRVDRAGRSSRTVFRLLRRWPLADPPMAMLDAELETGRTHQIRVHLTHIGYPLAGDDKYGDFAWNRELAARGLKRMFLHAHRFGFRHPLTDAAMVIESPLPQDLARFVATLDGSAADA